MINMDEHDCNQGRHWGGGGPGVGIGPHLFWKIVISVFCI